MKEIGLFSKVNANNREELIGKAYTAAKWLRLFAGITMLATIFTAIMLIIGSGIVGASGSDGIIASILSAAGSMLVTFVMLFFGLLFQLLILFYVSVLAAQLEQNILPELFVPYMFLVIAVINFVGSLSAGAGSVYVYLTSILYLFIVYLWYVFTSNVSKAKKL